MIFEGSVEWETAWQELAMHELNAGDPVCNNVDTGDSWQYMGTANKNHSFRHRSHPSDGMRKYIKIPEKNNV